MPIHRSSCRIFYDEWFKKSSGLSNAMGFNVVRMEGKCFIERGREIRFRNRTQKKKKEALCPYWCQFLQPTKKTTEKQLNYSAYVPLNGQ